MYGSQSKASSFRKATGIRLTKSESTLTKFKCTFTENKGEDSNVPLLIISRVFFYLDGRKMGQMF